MAYKSGWMFIPWIVGACLGWPGCLVIPLNALGQEAQLPAEPGTVVAKFSSAVPQVQSLVKGAWTKNWIRNVADLPVVQPRKFEFNGQEIHADEATYYSDRYGSPLAYARALDLAEEHGFRPQPNAQAKTKVLDFGYGSIGHLRMLALTGIDATGIDVAPLLPKLYEGATGKLGPGTVRLFHGSFPGDRSMLQDLGDSYDLFLSKNTLKKGYIHPSREVSNERMLIRLGVSDREFLNQVHKLLKPKGLFVIYNFCPAKAADDKPYIPWAEGESPFSKADLEAGGFEILALDIVDDVEARKLAKALAWDADSKMDLERDLFAWYTIARKKQE
jgi:SAM-dependent methyltransferase